MSAAPTAMGAPRNFSREGQSLGVMASAERESISRGSVGGAPAGSRGKARGQGPSRRPSFLKLKALKQFAHLKKAQKFAVNMPKPSK